MFQPQRFHIFLDRQFRWRWCYQHQALEGGFTLSEVLIAIILIATFVAVAMQGMVVAMLLKSKALQIAEANRWVQADLEQIRSQLTLNQIPIDLNRVRCHPASADLGFADLVRDNLAGGNVTGTVDYNLSTSIATSQTGKTFQIARTVSIPSASENTEAKILGIKYTVTPITGSNLEQPILHFYTEVMPDAALQCQ
jgi:prepilin-type N-terminal cleavage/methylation domain-containing protein